MRNCFYSSYERQNLMNLLVFDNYLYGSSKNKCSKNKHTESVFFPRKTNDLHFRRYTPVLVMQVGTEKKTIISPKKTFLHLFSVKNCHM